MQIKVCPSIRASRLPETRQRQRVIVCKATSYVPPSQKSGSTFLDALGSVSNCVPDTVPGGAVKASAATVNCSVISSILNSGQLGRKQAEVCFETFFYSDMNGQSLS